MLTQELGELSTGSLIDSEGYPKSGIDFHSVLTRGELSRAQSDYKEVMNDIEKQLPMALSSGKKYSTRPFAIVTQIDSHSLAEKLGMMVNDKILSLDDIARYDDLQEFSLGKEIYVKFLRGECIKKLQTTTENDVRFGARLEKY